MTYLGYRPETRPVRSFPARISLACAVVAVLTSTALFLAPTGRLVLLCVTIGLGLAGVLIGIVALRQLPHRAQRGAERALALTGVAASVLTLAFWATCGLLLGLIMYSFSHVQFAP